MSSYGGRLKYTVKFTLDSNLGERFHLADPDLILRVRDHIVYGWICQVRIIM